MHFFFLFHSSLSRGRLSCCYSEYASSFVADAPRLFLFVCFAHLRIALSVHFRDEYWMHDAGAAQEVMDPGMVVDECVAWKTAVLHPLTLQEAALNHHMSGHATGGERRKARFTYLFTEQTASMYVEYRIVKINRHGTRQPRTLGIDREKIYNLLPRAEVNQKAAESEEDALSDEEGGGVGNGFALQPSNSEGTTQNAINFLDRLASKGHSADTKKRARYIKDVVRCEIDSRASKVCHLAYNDGSKYRFEFETEQHCAEAVSRVNYILTLS